MDVFIPLNRFTFTWDPNRIAYNYNRDISLTKWKKKNWNYIRAREWEGKIKFNYKKYASAQHDELLGKKFNETSDVWWREKFFAQILYSHHK